MLQQICYRLRVSDLCKFYTCPKQSKLRCFSYGSENARPSKYTERGNELHYWYSLPDKDYDRKLLRYKLFEERQSPVLERTIGNITVRGIPDDFRVLLSFQNGKLVGKVVSLIEVKTTSRTRLYGFDFRSAIFQLQLYSWLTEPYLEAMGYQLHSRHYVEIFSQNGMSLLKRIVVYPKANMEDVILNIVETWEGLRPMTYPSEFTCKWCPKAIKAECGRFY